MLRYARNIVDALKLYCSVRDREDRSLFNPWAVRRCCRTNRLIVRRRRLQPSKHPIRRF